MSLSVLQLSIKRILPFLARLGRDLCRVLASLVSCHVLYRETTFVPFSTHSCKSSCTGSHQLQHFIVEMTVKNGGNNLAARLRSIILFHLNLAFSATLADSTAALTFNVSIRTFLKIKYDSNSQTGQSPLQMHNQRISID